MTGTRITSAALQRRLDELTRQRGVPGASVAVADGEHVHTAASGVANTATGVAATPDTLFQIGSATKPYTATLVLRLVDDGDVELDAPIQRYLPDLTLPGRANAAPVTVRELLAHTSGLQSNNFADFGRGDDAIARYVDSVGELGTVAPPAETFSYSNTGYVLLGRLVEVLTGMPYHRALHELLVKPAGLHSTVVLPEDAIMHRTAVGHTPDPGGGTGSVVAGRWTPSFAMAPAGSLTCATASDLLAFARIHTNQGRAADDTWILSTDSVLAMRRQQADIPDKHGVAESYGLGWFRYDWNGTPLFGHDGATESQRSYLRVDPETGFAVALLANQREGAEELHREIFEEIFQQGLGLRMPKAPEPTDEPERISLARYAGTYTQPEMNLELYENDESTVHARLSPNDPTLAGIMPAIDGLRLRPVDESVFLLYGVPGVADPTPVAFYDFDTAGTPNRLHFTAQAHTRR